MSLEKYRREADRWFLQAKADLRAAGNSAASDSFDWACFQAQQAGEKALKALWLSYAYDPWGHSLVKLIEDFPDEQVRSELLAFMPHAKRLDKLYIPTRYPNGLPDSIPADVFTEDEARAAMRTAEELLEELSGRLSS